MESCCFSARKRERGLALSTRFVHALVHFIFCSSSWAGLKSGSQFQARLELGVSAHWPTSSKTSCDPANSVESNRTLIRACGRARGSSPLAPTIRKQTDFLQILIPALTQRLGQCDLRESPETELLERRWQASPGPSQRTFSDRAPQRGKAMRPGHGWLQTRVQGR